jgi:hypothetical protein
MAQADSLDLPRNSSGKLGGNLGNVDIIAG